MSPILLTGATGFLGMELLDRFIELDEEVVALVRASDDAAAQRRIEDTLAKLYDQPPAHRIKAIAADLTHPIEPSPAIRRCDRVVHCAASVSFASPLAEARAINVAGTANVLDLAAALPALRHFVHVSTAYATGHGDGTYRNAYEQSKAEAEKVVRASGLPTTIVRPSIVVGDSRTGWTPVFNVIYWPLQAYARGLIQQLPGRGDGIVDIVPIDYVGYAINKILDGEPSADEQVLAAGSRSPTVIELLKLTSARFGQPMPALATGSKVLEQLNGVEYLPYLNVETTFDTAPTEKHLGCSAPPIADYFNHLLEYALSARWGRNPITRESAHLARKRSAVTV